MDKVQELQLQIEELKAKLRRFLDEERDIDETYQLSAQIDRLIVEYHKLTSNTPIH